MMMGAGVVRIMSHDWGEKQIAPRLELMKASVSLHMLETRDSFHATHYSESLN
jgi:hypothetical protein